MKYYIIDDDKSIVNMICNIIELKNLGSVLGKNTESDKALLEILTLNPDIVFIDLLMPKKDGISLVSEIKKIKKNIYFIMISQVTDKELISEAYKNGIEFFIHKPLNVIEIENVTKKVLEKIEMQTMIDGIKGMIINKEDNKISKDNDNLSEIKYLLNLIGILGERGSKDLLLLLEYILKNNIDYDKNTIHEYCEILCEDTKLFKQRIRRSLKKALSNIASLGIEDYYNEIFQSYSSLLFDFESIKAEMDCIRGKTNISGKISVDKFIEGLIIYSETR